MEQDLTLLLTHIHHTLQILYQEHFLTQIYLIYIQIISYIFGWNGSWLYTKISQCYWIKYVAPGQGFMVGAVGPDSNKFYNNMMAMMEIWFWMIFIW